MKCNLNLTLLMSRALPCKMEALVAANGQLNKCWLRYPADIRGGWGADRVAQVPAVSPVC